MKMITFLWWSNGTMTLHHLTYLWRPGTKFMRYTKLKVKSKADLSPLLLSGLCYIG